MNEEEEEKVIFSITPDAIKPKGAVRRNSTGKVNTKTLQSLSSSNGKLLPHYLRASTSSCHDFCKYGRKHIFEAKRRHPNFPRFSDNNGILEEEQNQAKVSTLRERMKRPELKVKATQPKDKLPDKPEFIKQKGLKKIQFSETPKNVDEESSEESESMKVMAPLFQESTASLEPTPFSEGEGSSEESISIKTVIPSPPHQVEELSEQPESIKLETSSLIEKNIASQVPTPVTWSEETSDGSTSMELETPSPIHTPVNQVEGSSEDHVGVELMTPSPVVESIIAPADEPTRTKLKTPSIQKRLKPKTPPPIRKSIASAKPTPPGRAEKSSEEGLGMKLKALSPVHKSIAATKEQHQMKSLKMGEGKKGEVMKLKTAPQAKTEVSDRAKAIKEKKIEVTGEPNNIKKKTPPVKKTITSVKPKITEQKSPSSVKEVITSVSPRVIKQKKASSPLKMIEVPAKSSISLKPKTPVVKSTSVLVSSARLTARKSQGNKLIRSADLSKLGEEKVLKPLRASLSPKPPVDGVSSLKLRKYRSSKPSTAVESRAKVHKLEHISEKVKEKTLYVIEPKPVKTDAKPIEKKPKKNKSYYSSQTSSSSSSPSSSKSVLSHENEEHEDYESTLGEASELVLDKGTNRNKPVRSPKGEEKRRPRRTATVHSEDKLLSPHKLKFRRGKIVSPESENNGPRKLRFRQAKRATENPKGKEVGRRSFRKRRESCGSAADLIAPSSEAPGIVLRHQDVQEKKDSQGLFNHVIEETASKLVETRKSKVKALVGAFETVISLQESRVSPPV